MDLKKQAYKGVKWTSLSSVCNAIIQFLRIAILARLLEKADFGLMAIVAMIMGFMSLFSDMGIGSAILHKQKISTNEYSSLYWFNFLVNTLLFILICLISKGISSFYHESQLIVLIPLMGVNLFFTAFGRQYAIIAQKELHFRFISSVEIITNIISILPAIVLAINDFGVYALIYSTLFASLCSNLCFFMKYRNEHKISFHYKFSETKPFLKIGIYQIGGQILNYFNTQFDVILIGKLLGTETLGIYNLAKNLAMRPSQIINPIITKLSAPLLSKIQHDDNLLKNSYLKIIKILACVNYPVHFFIAILSLPIINIVYGMNDSDMALILAALALYYMLRSIGNPVGGLVVAKGKTDIEFYWNVGITVAFPVFVYVGCMYSLIGVGIAQLVLMILGYIPGWYFLIKKLINVTLTKYTVQHLPYLFFSVIASIAVFISVLLPSHYSNITTFSCGFLVFVMSYFLCIFFFDKKMYKYLKNDVLLYYMNKQK